MFSVTSDAWNNFLPKFYRFPFCDLIANCSSSSEKKKMHGRLFGVDFKVENRRGTFSSQFPKRKRKRTLCELVKNHLTRTMKKPSNYEWLQKTAIRGRTKWSIHRPREIFISRKENLSLIHTRNAVTFHQRNPNVEKKRKNAINWPNRMWKIGRQKGRTWYLVLQGKERSQRTTRNCLFRPGPVEIPQKLRGD